MVREQGAFNAQTALKKCCCQTLKADLQKEHARGHILSISNIKLPGEIDCLYVKLLLDIDC
jgi:hypothetical protein